MSGFTETFLSNIRTKGFVKPNRFVAFIKPSPKVLSDYLGFPKNGDVVRQRLATTCFSASIPSPSFTTHEFGITSPQRLIPYAISSNNSSGMSLEFYCLGDMFEKEVFFQWMQGIVDPITREVSYYNDYAKDSEIDLVYIPPYVSTYEEMVEFISSETKEGASGVKFTEIYPYNYTINGGSVNYSPSTTPMTVKVDFMFRDIKRFREVKGYSDKDRNTTIDTKVESESPFRKEIREKSLEDSRREFERLQQRSLKIEEEKRKIAEAYNQSKNIPRGVDGKLLNPKVDGLPEENPNDRISRLLYGGLSFLGQVKGFGIVPRILG